MAKPVRTLKHLAFACGIVVLGSFWVACEDPEVADYNPEFRPIPTVERAPTVESAPTVEVAPTIAKFEGFEQAPTVTQFQGFSDDDPCTIFLEQPSPENAKRAAEWAMGHLDGAGGQIDPNDGLRVTAACQAVLGNAP